MTPPSTGVRTIRRVVAGVRLRARRSDLMLTAAALTCYAVLGLIPLLVIGIRVSASVVGVSAVVTAGDDLGRYVPGPLGVDTVTRDLFHAAATSGWLGIVAALVAVSFYTEGSVRCLERFSAVPERRSRTLRGRLLTGPTVVVVVTAVVVVVTTLRPLLEDPFGRGTAARLLGILVAFVILWIGLGALLCLTYRLFATTAVRPAALFPAAAAAGSWLAGQTLGYVAALRLLGGFAHAYGGYAPAGAVAALVFLAYLDHVVVLLGYTLALYLHEDVPFRSRTPSTGSVPGR